MVYDLRIIGRRIRQARESRHRSLAWMAEKTGVTEGYLSRLERGHIPTPGIQTLGSIARVLGMTLAELVGEDQASPEEIAAFFQSLFGASNEEQVQRIREKIESLEPEDQAIIVDMIEAIYQRSLEARERRRREGRRPREEPPEPEPDPPKSTVEPEALLVYK